MNTKAEVNKLMEDLNVIGGQDKMDKIQNSVMNSTKPIFDDNGDTYEEKEV